MFQSLSWPAPVGSLPKELMDTPSSCKLKSSCETNYYFSITVRFSDEDKMFATLCYTISVFLLKSPNKWHNYLVCLKPVKNDTPFSETFLKKIVVLKFPKRFFWHLKSLIITCGFLFNSIREAEYSEELPGHTKSVVASVVIPLTLIAMVRHFCQSWN